MFRTRQRRCLESAARQQHNLHRCRCRCSARRACRCHRSRRVRQEFAGAWLSPERESVVSIDQCAIRGSRRSNPATYTGLLDPIRNAFAKANGVKPALFSCELRRGLPELQRPGVIYTELAMMAGVATTCEECDGKRFDASVLEYHLGGSDISEVLAMSVTEAGSSSAPARRDAAAPRSSSGSPTSGSATSASASHSRRCPVASVSGSSSPPHGQEGCDLRPRRADHRPALRRCRAAARPPRPARRCRATR